MLNRPETLAKPLRSFEVFLDILVTGGCRWALAPSPKLLQDNWHMPWENFWVVLLWMLSAAANPCWRSCCHWPEEAVSNPLITWAQSPEKDMFDAQHEQKSQSAWETHHILSVAHCLPRLLFGSFTAMARSPTAGAKLTTSFAVSRRCKLVGFQLGHLFPFLSFPFLSFPLLTLDFQPMRMR